MNSLQDSKSQSTESIQLLENLDLINSSQNMDKKSTINIFLMSFGFLFVFTAFNTNSLIQKVVVESINQDWDVGWNGFTSLAIVYVTFSFSNFLTPSILTSINSSQGIFIGSLFYFLYISAFLYPLKYVLNLVSIGVGFGASLIWISQGKYITENAEKNQIERKTGIFWAIFQQSLIFGNLFVYFKFQNINKIDDNSRIVTYSVLAVICLIGCFLNLLLIKRKTKLTSTTSSINHKNPWKAFKICVHLFFTKKMMALSVLCFYTGLLLSFYSGIYATVVGYTTAFGSDSKKLIGIYGISVGIGSVFGGFLFIICGNKFNRLGKSFIVTLGYIVHCLSFFLIFINHPFEATFKETDATGYIHPMISISLLCGFLIGFGDSCLNTQIYCTINSLYTKDEDLTNSAFAIYKFTQSVAASLLFFISNFELLLYEYLIILFISSTFGVLFFFCVDFNRKKIDQN